MILIGNEAASARGHTYRVTTDMDFVGSQADADAFVAAMQAQERVIVFPHDSGYSIMRAILVTPQGRKTAGKAVGIRIWTDELLAMCEALPDNVVATSFGQPIVVVSPITVAIIKRSLWGVKAQYELKHKADLRVLKAANYFGYELTTQHIEFFRACREMVLAEPA